MELKRKRDTCFKFLKTSKSSLLKIGYISKPHGIKGEVFVKTFNENPHWPELNTLFVQSETKLSPFLIEFYRPHKSGWIFKLQNVNSRDESEKLVSHSVLLAKDQFISREKEKVYLFEIKNFSVKTKKEEYLGQVTDFSLNKNQDLICVEASQKKILIPFVPDYIVKINYDQKLLILDLPSDFLKEFR